jgi:hypothetical protein
MASSRASLRRVPVVNYSHSGFIALASSSRGCCDHAVGGQLREACGRSSRSCLVRIDKGVESEKHNKAELQVREMEDPSKLGGKAGGESKTNGTPNGRTFLPELPDPFEHLK